MSATPPRYQHESYDEDLYEWTERGIENPHDVTWSQVFYTCKFCPAQGDTPEEVDHSPSCPCSD